MRWLVTVLLLAGCYDSFERYEHAPLVITSDEQPVSLENPSWDAAPPSDVVRPRLVVSSGYYRSCALLFDGTFMCWGSEEHGPVELPSGRYRQLSLAGHLCGLLDSGRIECWNEAYQEGQGETPAGVFIQVAAAGRNTCALRPDGTITCWGSAWIGAPPPGHFVQLSGGFVDFCALDATGQITCWGHGPRDPFDAPEGVFTQVSVGIAHVCALTIDGEVSCWGDNTFGQLDAPSGRFVEVTVGGDHACALDDVGNVTCWGADLFNIRATSPVGTFTSVSAGFDHTCAVTTEDTVTCWGRDTWGQASPPEFDL